MLLLKGETMKKQSIYKECTSGIVQKGELIFPFNSFGVKIDWDKVLEEVMKDDKI